MGTTKRRLAAGLLALAISVPTAALADSAGTAGKMIAFEHNDDSSDDYNGDGHGSVLVDEGDGTPGRYRWGGSYCPTRVLERDQQAMLVAAMAGKLLVLPYYKIGNGGTRCLTSFIFVPKKAYVDDAAK